MQRTYYITAIAAFALFFACCKKDGNEYWGNISALKNGSPWEGKIRAEQTIFSSVKAEIFIETFDKDGVLTETLFFYKVPKKVGTYHLSQTINSPPDDSLTGCFYTNGYKDELFDIYDLVFSDSTSYLEITEYNEEKGELRGKFNLILWPSIPGSWNAPDSLVFSDGVFHTRIN